MEKMVCSIVNPYRIADDLRRRVGLFQLSWGVMYFSIQDSVSHGIAPIQITVIISERNTYQVPLELGDD